MCQVEKWMCIGLDGLNRNDTDRLTLDRSDLPSTILTANVPAEHFFAPCSTPLRCYSPGVPCTLYVSWETLQTSLSWMDTWSDFLQSNNQGTRHSCSICWQKHTVFSNNVVNKQDLNPTFSPCNQSMQGGEWHKWGILGREYGHLRPLNPVLLLQWGAHILSNRIRPWLPLYSG